MNAVTFEEWEARHRLAGEPALAPIAKPRAAALQPDRLYLGDNGRCFCGRLRCAGSSAHFTGRDLSGQRVALLDAKERALAELAGLTFRCETCGLMAVAVCR